MTDTLQRITPERIKAAHEHIVEQGFEAMELISEHQEAAEAVGDKRAVDLYEMVLMLLNKQIDYSSRWATQLEKDARHAN